MQTATGSCAWACRRSNARRRGGAAALPAPPWTSRSSASTGLDGQILRAVLRAVLLATAQQLTSGAAHCGHAALVGLLLELRLWQRDGAQQACAAVQHADLVRVRVRVRVSAVRVRVKVGVWVRVRVGVRARIPRP
eukprot:scaffold39017_cov60-Phaeocystis_antarctica.AAC.2